MAFKADLWHAISLFPSGSPGSKRSMVRHELCLLPDLTNTKEVPLTLKVRAAALISGVCGVIK